MGRIPPHPQSKVHGVSRCQAGNRERNGENSGQQQGHQSVTDKPQNLLPTRSELDIGGSTWVDEGICPLLRTFGMVY